MTLSHKNTNQKIKINEVPNNKIYCDIMKLVTQMEYISLASLKIRTSFQNLFPKKMIFKKQLHPLASKEGFLT